MLSDDFGISRFRILYIFLNWAIFFNLAIAGVYAIAAASLVYADVANQRFQDWQWIRVMMVLPFSWWPPYQMHQLMYHNIPPRYYRWFWIAFVVVNCIIEGTSLGFLTFDYFNCDSVTYCMNNGSPSSGSNPDTAFVFTWWLLFALIACGVGFYFASLFIKERVEDRQVIDYWSDPRRSSYKELFVNSRIGSFLSYDDDVKTVSQKISNVTGYDVSGLVRVQNNLVDAYLPPEPRTDPFEEYRKNSYSSTVSILKRVFAPDSFYVSDNYRENDNWA